MNTKGLSLSAIIISAALLVASCINSDDTTTATTYEDTAITSFTLGTVKVTRNVGYKKYAKNDDGTPIDSFYTYSYAGSNIPVHIDQLSREIYNIDSLPAGSRMKMLVTVTSKNSNTITYRDWDAADDASWTYYSASDSIEFVDDVDAEAGSEMKPLRFRVWASEGGYSRDYKVEIVSHGSKEYADSFQYVSLAPQSIFADATSLRGASTKNGIYVLAVKDGESKLYAGTDFGDTWRNVTISYVEEDGKKDLESLGDAATIASSNDKLYVLDDDKIYYTEDGETWQTAKVNELKTLVCAAGGKLFALGSDGGIKAADADNLSGDWDTDNVFDNADLLPASDINAATVVQKTNSSVTRITIVGNKAEYTEAGDTCAVVWNKNVGTASNELWIYNDPTEAKTKSVALPAMKWLSATGYYNGWILAIGGEGLNRETTLTSEAYRNIFCSEDGGTSWHKVKGLRMPDTTLDSSKPSLIVADTKGYFYIISADGGKVYRCRLNNATWDSTEWEVIK